MNIKRVKLLVAIVILICNSNSSLALTLSDSLKLHRFTQHIYSLDHIIRKSDNSPYFVKKSNNYCDSILLIQPENEVAMDFKVKNKLIESTCSQNVNYKVNFYPYLSNSLSYMGFADDPIEYAYDNSINQLLSSKYYQLYNGPLGEVSITSLVINDNTSEEMYEIGIQTFLANCSHYILSSHIIDDILGKERGGRIRNGTITSSDLDTICSHLHLDKLGVFYMKDLDVIDDKIWLVQSSFQLFDSQNGLSEPIANKGFAEDKRYLSIIDTCLYILFSLSLISMFSFISILISKLKVLKIIKYRELLKLLYEQFLFALKSSLLPLILSIIIVYFLSHIAPLGPDHYLEFNSKYWILSLVLLMSFTPTLLNVFILNRIKLDGLHTIRGYRVLLTSSIASVSTLFASFQFINSGSYNYLLATVYILNAQIIADMIARSYYQYSSHNKVRIYVTRELLGMSVGTILLMLMIGNLIMSNSSIIVLANLFISILVAGCILLIRRQKASPLPSNGIINLNNESPFISSLINPKTKIYNAILQLASDHELNVMLISGQAGIGKTRSLLQVKDEFINSGWDWYYGDCDQNQDETSPSFEPFLEAFKDLLAIEEFYDRGKHIDNVVNTALGASSAILPADPETLLKPYEKSGSERMTETCLEIIETLEKKGKKSIFIMEDLHWIDPESYELLKLFIQVINRNRFARANVTIVLTIREDGFANYRGPNNKKLQDDLNELQTNTSNKFEIHSILNNQDFNVVDFIMFMNNEISNFKLQNTSAVQINDLFNKSIESIKITPKYILDTLKSWITNETLIPSSEGYALGKPITIDDLPVEEGADYYYYNIIDKYDPKWIRLLETAAIIGNRFDANIIAKVWNYELLEVLSFLETAVKDKILIDVSKEDNIFQFGEENNIGSEKRIINAIKTFYEPSQSINSEKQIVLEYNKRFINIHSHHFEDLANLSNQDLLMYIKRLCTLIPNQSYLKVTERLIFEVVCRLVYQGLTEKLNSVISILYAYDELKVLSQLLRVFIDKYSHLEEKVELSYSPESNIISTLILNLSLLDKLIKYDAEYQKTEISINQIKYIEDELIYSHSPDVAIYIICMLSKIKFEDGQFDEKLVYLEKYHKKLNPSVVGQHMYLCNKVELEYQQNILIPKDKEQLDSNSLNLYLSIKSNPLLSFLKVQAFNLRSQVISFILEDDNQAIKEFRSAINEDFGKRDFNWLKVTLNFLTSYCASIYFQSHPKEASALLTDCERVTYKYFDENIWNSIIDKLLTARSSFSLNRGNNDAALEFSIKNSKLMRDNNRIDTFNYRNNCTKMAKIYEAMGEGQKAIDKKLESIQILEQRIKDSKESNDLLRKELSIDYNNISHVFRNHLNDYENALKYAILSLELKKPEEGKAYGISLYSVGRAYDAMRDYSNALKYYHKAKKYFLGNLPREVYQLNVLQLNLGIAMALSESKDSNEILNNSIKALQNEQMKAYLTEPIKERIQFAKSLIQ